MSKLLTLVEPYLTNLSEQHDWIVCAPIPLMILFESDVFKFIFAHFTAALPLCNLSALSSFMDVYGRF